MKCLMHPDQWRQVEELYYDALEVPEAGRAAFLAHVCADEPEARREVESLLAARNEAGGFLSRPALERSLLSGAQRAALNARIGSSIGQYQLLSVLGVGGMGEVFLAEDTRLHRQVALKLLPPQFSQQPGRVRRFEQEARATTALNHPNIVTLYDTGQHEGSYFIVNEFVDGQTLRAHLNEHGPLPISEALNIAQQIATALSAAHAAGIVHRDIKPENVMLRRDGFVKVLDFGLAKLTGALPEPPVDQDDTHDEETPQAAIHQPQSQTAAGVLLGTIRYMSPEQARGDTVDARTDVFSLGVVLYEMLTGRTPFHRETATETLAAILEAEPPALPETIPLTLRRLVMNALGKDRVQRLQTAEELAAALRGVAEEAQFSVRLSQINLKPQVRWWLWAGGGALILGMALVAYFVSQPSVRFETEVLPKLKFSFVDGWKTEPMQALHVLSSSPDGTQLTFAKVQNGQPDIYVKRVGGGPAQQLTNDAWNDSSPLWSPDGSYIAYLSVRDGNTQVRRVPLTGGAGELLGTLAGVTNYYLVGWTRNGARIYYEIGSNLYALEVASGTSRRLTDFPSGAGRSGFAVSADDQWMVYREVVAGVLHLFVTPLAGGAPIQLTHEGEVNTEPHWLPDNRRLVYGSQHNGVKQLFVVARDGGKPVQFSFGHEMKLPWEVTLDGRRIFYIVQRADADIYLLDVRTGTERQFSSDALFEAFPAFAPDGRSLAYQQARTGEDVYGNALYTKPLADGLPVHLSESGFDLRWSPTGERLAFLRESEPSKYQLWTVRPDGTDARLAVNAPVNFIGYDRVPLGWRTPPNFNWSTDGRSLIYASDRSGTSNLYALAPDGTGEQQLTHNSDTQWRYVSPLPAPDGQQLLYLSLGRRNTAGQRPQAIFTLTNGQAHQLWQTAEGHVRLLGWDAAGKAIYFAVSIPKRADDLSEVTLFRLALSTSASAPAGPARPVAQIANAYLHTFALAPDGKQVAYVVRQNEVDNLWLAAINGDQRRQLTTNTNPQFNLGCLAWSPQANQLSYIKQSNTDSIWQIENFQ
jgi:eukaryotic-like serine/threonine-protein kinase